MFKLLAAALVLSSASIDGHATPAAAAHEASARASGTAVPTIFWSSQPARPGDAIVISAGNSSDTATAVVTRLDDQDPGSPLAHGKSSNDGWKDTTPLQATSRSMKVVLPGAKAGVFAYRIKSGASKSAAAYVNAPDVWFAQGDQGWAASPGGKLRLYGTGLKVAGSPTGQAARIALVKNDSVVATLFAEPANGVEAGYEAAFAVPADLAPGQYTLYMHNGSGGPSAWSKYTGFGFGPEILSPVEQINTVRIARPAAWPTGVCPVAPPDTNANADDASFTAAFACAQAMSGAVIQMAAGTYHLTSTYAQGFGSRIPNHSILRGKGKDGASTTTLEFPLALSPPAGLLAGLGEYVPLPPEYGSGNQFTQGLFSVDNLVVSAPNMTSGAAIYFNYMRIADSGWAPWVRNVRLLLGPSLSHSAGIHASNMSNLQLTDNEITAGFPIQEIGRIRGSFIKGNTLTWYYQALMVNHNAQNNVIVGNKLIFPDVAPPEGNVTSAFAAPSRDVYYAANVTSQVGNRSFWGLTLDEGNGIYFGAVAGSQGKTLTLASAVQNLDYMPDPAGDSVMIMSGKGAGQMRFVVSNPTPDTLTLSKPWDVDPDTSSIVSVCTTVGRMLFVNNTYGADSVLNAFFPSADVVMANNTLPGPSTTMIQQTGIYISDVGVMPGWHFQLLDNTVLAGAGSFASQGVDHGFQSGEANAWYTDSVTQTSIIRGNVFAAGATGAVSLWDLLSNSLIEHNVVPGIEIHNAHVTDSLVRGNVSNAGGAPTVRNDSSGAGGTLVLP